MVDQSLASRLEKDFKRIRCEPTFVPIPSRSIDHTNQHRDHVTRPVQLTQAPPLPLLDNRIEISAPNRSGVVESSLAARGFPGLSRLNVDDFSLFQGVPGEMKGKRKREGMRERSIGRVVKTEAVRSQGGGGRVRSARCHIPLVGLPGFKSVLLGPPLPSAIIGRNKLNRFFLGRPPSYFAALARFSSSSCCFATSRDRRVIADFAHPPPRHVGRGDREGLWTFKLDISFDFEAEGGRGMNVFTE